MATARKCDICGAFYDQKREKETPVNGIAMCYFNPNDTYQLKNFIDCCPECLEAIQKLINERSKPNEM